MKKGKLIVIEGADGSGKATQTGLLIKRLKKEIFDVRTMDFPRYYDSVYGDMVGRFLKGEYGTLKEINPYLAAILYALDRKAAQPQLIDWLHLGKIVVANRYVSSNQAHQASRIETLEDRKKFLRWLDTLEYGIHSLPRPDILFFLDVPVEVSLQLITKKEKRKYLGAKKDIQESDRQHLKRARGQYLYLVKHYKNWFKINCCDKKGNILKPEKIHEKIWEITKSKIS